MTLIRPFLFALVIPSVAVALPPLPDDGQVWNTLNPDGTIRETPPPDDRPAYMACSCRPPYEGFDGALYRQCLCTPPSPDAPAPDAPLSWLVQRSNATLAQRVLAGTP